MKRLVLFLMAGILKAQIFAGDSTDWIDLPVRERETPSIPAASEIDHYTLDMSDTGEPRWRSISRSDGDFIIAALREGKAVPSHGRINADVRFTFAVQTRDGKRVEFHCESFKGGYLHFTVNWETCVLPAASSAAVIKRLGLANLPNQLHRADDRRFHASCGAGERASLDRRSSASR